MANSECRMNDSNGQQLEPQMLARRRPPDGWRMNLAGTQMDADANDKARAQNSARRTQRLA